MPSPKRKKSSEEEEKKLSEAYCVMKKTAELAKTTTFYTLYSLSAPQKSTILTKMSFSVSERDYLYKSLSSKTPIRPDGRKPHQFRGLEASINFLPNSNGSSRIRLSDGSEVIISIKTKVVKVKEVADLIEIDLNIDNLRDDLTFVVNWTNVLKNLLLRNFTKFEALRLTSKYYFKLYIDVMYLSGNSSTARSKGDSLFLQNPLTLISFGLYTALKSTRLPLLISSTNDKEIEELPTFNDDWSSTILLYPEEEQEKEGDAKKPSNNGTVKEQPPLLFVISVINGNLFIDPTVEEQEVSENGLLLGWSSGKVVSPMELINLNQSGNPDYIKGVNQSSLITGISLVNKVAGVVAKNLDEIVKDGNNSEFLDSIF